MVGKKILKGLVTFALIGLSACGSAEEDKAEAEAKTVAPSEPTKVNNGPKSEAQVKQELKVFQDSVEKAMNDIPPELREKFQTAFSCEIARNSKSPQPKEINAATIREITARLKAGAAATC